LYHVYLYRYQIAWEEKKFNKVWLWVTWAINIEIIYKITR